MTIQASTNKSQLVNTVVNNQSCLTKHKRQTVVVNKRPRNHDIYETKKVVLERHTFTESIRNRSNSIADFGDSITKFRG